MNQLKRKVYKRGSSYEVTIPKSLLWNLDLEKKYCVVFRQEKSKWIFKFELLKNKKEKIGEIWRRIYKRGSSFETTLPMPMLFTLDLKKNYFAVFDSDLSIELERGDDK